MSASPPLPPDLTAFAGTLQEFRTRELVLLRGVARNVAAWLQEPSDPALSDVLPELRVLSAELTVLRRKGHARGWQ